MTVYYEEEGSLNLPINCRNIAEQVVNEVLDYVKCPYESEVNLLVTMNEEIRELNSDFRNLDSATDVLSFPQVEYVIPAHFEALEKETICFHPETGELLLGDIVISKEKVIAQAEEYGHSIQREFAFLIAHSMLHLLGYDHMENLQRMEMEEKQTEILAKLNMIR